MTSGLSVAEKPVGISGHTAPLVVQVLIGGCAILAAVSLKQITGQMYFAPFVVATLVSALYGGIRAGSIAGAVGLVAYAFMAPPSHSFEVSPPYRVPLGTLFASSTFVLLAIWACSRPDARRKWFMRSAITVLVTGAVEPEHVAKAAVGSFADWCVIDELEENGTLERCAGLHTDSTLRAALWRTARYRSQDAGSPIAEAINGRKTAAMHSSDGLELWHGLPCRSCICVPLIANDRITGIMTMGSVRRNRYVSPEDLDVAAQIAHHLALAMYASRLERDLQEAKWELSDCRLTGRNMA